MGSPESKGVTSPILNSQCIVKDTAYVLTREGMSGIFACKRVSNKGAQPARSSSAYTWMTWRPCLCAQQPEILQRFQ